MAGGKGVKLRYWCKNCGHPRFDHYIGRGRARRLRRAYGLAPCAPCGLACPKYVPEVRA